ncbi:MAG TPA: PmoA family protein [Acidobacteriaceae bacterium]|nr:PmoA family protein [Acidobacteriaceae bacterium]
MKLFSLSLWSRCAALVIPAIVLMSGFGIAQVKVNQRAVKLIQHKKTIDVKIHGKLFTTYHFADDFILPYTRPFFWPVLANDGTEVTIDHAQHPPLHAWQRSIWIGAGDVNGADQWSFKARPIPKQRHIQFDKINKDGFREELIWEDKAGEPMLHEVRTVHFLAYDDGARGINICIAFTPVSGDVTFFNHRDHGILSVRPTPSIAEAPHFTSDDGSDSCKGRTSWCDESGLIDEKTYGAAIFDDPDNPRHPPLWHAGPNARLATDIFLTRQGAPRHDPNHSLGDFTIKAGQTVKFRYGIVIHSGNAAAAKVRQKYEYFISDKGNVR